MIQKNVKKAIGGKFPLYSLGSGNDVDFEFLKKLSLENNGVAVRIYEDSNSDVDLQLKVRYKQITLGLSPAWVIFQCAICASAKQSLNLNCINTRTYTETILFW